MHRLKWLPVLIALAAMSLAAWVFRPSTTPDPIAERTVTRPRPVPRPRVASRPVPLPPPPPVVPVAPPPPPVHEPPEPLPIDARVALNRSAWDAMVEIRAACLLPHVQATGEDAEVVVHVRVLDGQVTDLKLRPLTDLPDDVVRCAHDTAWGADWHSDDTLEGEVLLQRKISVYPD
ncbi:MAG: hypothetical protein ACI8PZ_001609 [Myxococcota bacterium]|jgi:hypothetical protein